jgi:2-desacetyl-2-hydroxyethyl bacteriochlorophyllide A dehydrogenase
MPRTVQAVTVLSPGNIALEVRPAPATTAGDVLIRPQVVGICGTDLDIIDGRIDPEYVRYPIILGHEWSGVVVDPGLTPELKPGDRVVVEGIVPCGHCSACMAGDTNRCETYDEFGFVRDGAMTELLVAPSRLVHRLAPSVSRESGALVEPASVAMRALLRAEPQPGQRVLVIGDGTIALLAARLVRLWSPSWVAMIGHRSEQSDLAQLAGIDQYETDPVLIDGSFDLVIEAAGSISATELVVPALKRGGKAMLLGFPGHEVDVPIPIDDIVNGDLTIIGSFAYTSTAWRHIVTLLNSGRLDLDFLVTHRFGLHNWANAIETLRHSTGKRGKVIIDLEMLTD